MRMKLRPQRGGPLLIPCLSSQTARSRSDAGVGMEMDSRTKLDVGMKRLELPKSSSEMGKETIYILRSIIKDVLGGVVRLAIDQEKLVGNTGLLAGND